MSPLTPEEFRRVTGRFATGVSLVTTAHDGEVRAMTANSVTSVSLDPLSLLVCVNREAITHRVLSASAIFCVNVLNEEQEALARACARPDTPEAGLEGVRYRVGLTGAPILEEALAYVDCRVATAFDFGTHTIFIGQAVDMGSAEGRPLLFYGGKYAHFG